MAYEARTPELVVAEIATLAHGVVTRAELLEAGLTAHQIARRVRVGWLHRAHPGVYRVGHRAPSDEARYLAAVRACGDGALLSGRAAAHLYGLVARPPRPEVTAPTERRVKGVVTHRSPLVCATEAASWRGVPVTSVRCTLVDVAGRLSRAALARACHEAGVRFRTTPDDVDEALAHRPESRGAGRLRAVLSGEVPVTLSGLERRFLALARRAGLPPPQTNRRAGGRRVDCRWPAFRLTVELDSYRYHSSRHAWERDRLREREARARGDEHRRYTHADVFEDPEATIGDLRRLLERSSPAPVRAERTKAGIQD